MKRLALIILLIYITLTSFTLGFGHGKDVPIVYSTPTEVQD